MSRKFIEAYIMDCANRQNNRYMRNDSRGYGYYGQNDSYQGGMDRRDSGMMMNDGYGYYGYGGQGRVGYYQSHNNVDYDRRQSRPMNNMDYTYENDMGYDYQGYGDMLKQMRLNREDLHKWKKKIEESCKFWKSEELMPYIRKYNDIRFDRYTEEELVVTINMLHSDFKKALGDNPDIYIKLAKLFLEDEDSEVKGSERLALYYNCFVDCDPENDSL